MDIVYTLEYNKDVYKYLLFDFTVSIKSLLYYNGEDISNIYIIVLNDNANIIKDYIKQLYIENINVIQLDTTQEFYNGVITNILSLDLPNCCNKQLSTSALIRFYLYKILPENVKNILYIDCDVYFCSNIIKNFYDNNFQDKLFVGYEDKYIKYYNVKQQIEFNHVYINSGILFINLDKLQRVVNHDKLFNYFKNYNDKIQFLNQDIFNILFDENLNECVAIIDDEINVNQTCCIENNIKTPKVLHNYGGKTKLFKLYLYYKQVYNDIEKTTLYLYKNIEYFCK